MAQLPLLKHVSIIFVRVMWGFAGPLLFFSKAFVLLFTLAIINIQEGNDNNDLRDESKHRFTRAPTTILGIKNFINFAK